jgi:hypothetical protein
VNDFWQETVAFVNDFWREYAGGVYLLALLVIGVLPMLIALLRRIPRASILGVLWINAMGVLLSVFPAGVAQVFQPISPVAGVFVYLVAFVWACVMPNRINREAFERRHYELLGAIQKLGEPQPGATTTVAPAPTEGLVATTVGERVSFPMIEQHHRELLGEMQKGGLSLAIKPS